MGGQSSTSYSGTVRSVGQEVLCLPYPDSAELWGRLSPHSGDAKRGIRAMGGSC